MGKFPERPTSMLSVTPRLPGTREVRKWRPGTFNPFLIGIMTTVMLGLAVALEVALFESNKREGFHIPTNIVWNFGGVQWLKSFLPTTLISGLVLLWSKQDQWLRILQPYVELSKGHATAERSILTDYVSHSKFRALATSIKNRHWIVMGSAVVAIIMLTFQPLAGSLFLVRTLPKLDPTIRPAITLRTLGLDPNFSDLTAFVAAAGFAQAAVQDDLPDPPFVKDNFTVAPFEIPASDGLNGTISVHTTGIQTTLNCDLPDTGSITEALSANSTSLLDISAKWKGCTVRTSVNIGGNLLARNQYGVSSAAPCGSQQGLSIVSQPVMFWFLNATSGQSGQGKAKVVLCMPTIQAYNVVANANLTTSALQEVQITSTLDKNNNVTGNGLNGKAFNGVLFNTSDDPFVQARATATTTGVPGTIFQLASQQAGGVVNAFQNEDTFLQATVKVYTQHLSIIAKNVYFVPNRSTVDSQMTSLETRLWVDGRSAHSLAALLLLSSVLTMIIFFSFGKITRNLHLLQQPGSIAFSSASTHNSRWAELLNPRDDYNTMASKLKGMVFGLDHEGGVVVQNYREDIADAVPLLERGQKGSRSPPDVKASE